MVTPMEPQAPHLIGQVEQPMLSVRRLLVAVAIIAVSVGFAICAEMVRTHLLPDINVWLLGAAPAIWFAIRLVQTPWQTPRDGLDGLPVCSADARPSHLAASTH
jgi:hypothetical protein